ncbi:hypothetical protein D3C87_1558680 [compost metagenome]
MIKKAEVIKLLLFFPYIVKPINSNIIPENTLIAYIKPNILIFSFKFLFILNKTINPTPAFASNPAIIDAALIN